jgi:plasmanylethanolamine desaturase
MFSSMLGTLTFSLHQGIVFIGEIAAVLLAADFASGVGHWLEDAYGRPDFPVTGGWITQKNILHHHDPRYFTKHNWWQSNWDLACLGVLIVLVAWGMGHLTWQVWMFAVLGANANEIHKLAHRTPRENGRVITLFQRLHILQSARHHAKHHTNPKDSHYCVITDFLNPFFDGIRFWGGMEWLLASTVGLRRRKDESVPQTGGSEFDAAVPQS